MVANFNAVEPDCCPELRFVNAQNSHTLRIRDFEPALIPQPVALLPRHASVVDGGTVGKAALADPILKQHPAVELIHLRKRGLVR